MSVTTEADNQLNFAKEEIKNAIQSLSKIVVNECWGTDDYHPDYRKVMRNSLSELMDIREALCHFNEDD